MEERIQKIISAAGIASRRAAEELIRDGRVKVNGTVVTELGSKADPSKDHIKVDGKLIKPQQPQTNLILNKPVGFVTTMSDPEGRPIVQDLLKNVKVRVYPVGRLDYNTEGLLLLTNDGDFAHLVTHPKHELPKRYLAKIKGALSDAAVERLETGIFLVDGKTAPARVRRLRKEEANSWVEITIHEGKKRQVRRMFDHVGHSVIKLRRVRVGNLALGDLPPGAFRHLTGEEVKALRDMAEGEQARSAEFVVRKGKEHIEKHEAGEEEVWSTVPPKVAGAPEPRPKRDKRSMAPPDIAIMPDRPRLKPKKQAAGPTTERPRWTERGPRPVGERRERPASGTYRSKP